MIAAREVMPRFTSIMNAKAFPLITVDTPIITNNVGVKLASFCVAMLVMTGINSRSCRTRDKT